MRSSRLQRRYEARRLDILRAAGREFRTRGFAETGMREIAAAADLSPANLYNYFGGKDEILFFCQDSALDRLIVNLEKTRRAKATATEKLRSIVAFHLHCVLDDIEGSAAHLLTNSIPPHLQKRLLAKRDCYEHGVRRLIAAGIRTSEFFSADPALVARAILGALNSTIAWFNPQGPLSTEELAENFATFLIHGLCSGRGLARPTVAQPILAVSNKTAPRRSRENTAARKVANSLSAGNSTKKLSDRGSEQW